LELLKNDTSKALQLFKAWLASQAKGSPLVLGPLAAGALDQVTKFAVGYVAVCECDILTKEKHTAFVDAFMQPKKKLTDFVRMMSASARKNNNFRDLEVACVRCAAYEMEISSGGSYQEVSQFFHDPPDDLAIEQGLGFVDKLHKWKGEIREHVWRDTWLLAQNWLKSVVITKEGTRRILTRHATDDEDGYSKDTYMLSQCKARALSTIVGEWGAPRTTRSPLQHLSAV
jgi:hypothetical protein